MPDTLHDQIHADRQAALPNAEGVNDFRDYARGIQKSTLEQGTSQVLQSLIGHLFCDNLCRMALQAITTRMKLIRFDVSGDGAGKAAVEDYLEETWVKNGIPHLASQVHFAAARDGNQCVSLRWLTDPYSDAGGRTILTREPYWNGSSGVFVAYDDADLPTYAVKEWRQGSFSYRTVWYADRIERYVSRSMGNWTAYNKASDPGGEREGEGAKPVPWLDKAGRPLGIPLVHFAYTSVPNDPRGDAKTVNGKRYDADSRQGRSELDGGLLGLQDEVNDIHRDITAAARFTAFQVPYATGIELAPDPNLAGQYLPIIYEPGTFVTMRDPSGSFGVLPAGSLTELERALMIKLEAVSRSTTVPLHVLKGEFPSGAALLMAQMGLIEKVEAITDAFDPAWASVAHKDTKLKNAFGGGELDESLMIRSVFAPASSADPLTQSQIAAAEAPFVSLQETLRNLGKSPSDIERIMQEKEDEAKSVTMAAAVNDPQQALKDRIAARRKGSVPAPVVPTVPNVPIAR